MAKGKQLTTIINFAGDVDPSLLKAATEAAKTINKFSADAKKNTKKFFSKENFQKIGKGFASVAKTIGVSLLATATATAIAIGGVAKEGISLASNLEEVQNVVSTTFGAGEEAINKFAQTALNQFGVSELNAKQFTGTLGAMFKSMGVGDAQMLTMSQNLAALSGDMASFYNLDTQEAFDKIRAGISGETEPLKQLGINMSVANLEEFAKAQGQTTKYADMGQADQATLRYAYLMKVSADAQGDFNRTSDGFANQQRLVQENFKQLSARVMQGILPSLSKVMSTLNDFMATLDTQPIQDLVGAFGEVVIGMIPLIQEVLPVIVSLLTQMAPLFFDIIIGIIPLIQAVLPMLVSVLTQAIPLVFDIINGLIPIIQDILPAFSSLLTMILPIVAQVIELLMPIVQVLLKAVIDLLTPLMPLLSAVLQFLAPILNVLGVIIGALCEVLGFVLTPIIEWLSQKYEEAAEVFQVIGEWLGEFFKKIKEKAMENIKKFLDVFKTVGDFIKNLFGGGKDKEKDEKAMTQYANGGFASRASIFGEAGLEAAIPIKPGNSRSLALLAQTAKMLRVPQTIMQTFAGNGMAQAEGIENTSLMRRVSQVLQERFMEKVRGSELHSTLMSTNSNYNQTFIINYNPTFSGGDGPREQIRQGINDIREMIEDIMYQRARVSYE